MMFLFLHAVAAAFRLDFASRLLREARRHIGTVEDAQRNRGTKIDEWNTSNRSDVGSNYCANFLAWCARKVGGYPDWLTLSPSARVWMVEAQRAGRWVTKEQAMQDPSLVRPGMFAVWDRSDPNVEGSDWWAHIGLVNGELAGGHWPSLEANSGSDGRRTLVMDRSLKDGRLYGFGVFY